MDESVAVEVEISEWFDWMREEMPQGGVSLPSEENAVLFITRSLRLADRLRKVYRHFSANMHDTFMKSAIVYLCWQRQVDVQAKTARPGKRDIGTLQRLNAIRYIRPIATSVRHHLVEASDGSQYVVTAPHGFSDTLQATEMICNQLGRLMGLPVPRAAMIEVAPELLRCADLALNDRSPCHSKYRIDLCCGFELGKSNAVDKPNCRQQVGILVIDILTMNLVPRIQPPNENKGRLLPIEWSHFNDGGCLSGSDWFKFWSSTFASVPSPQPAASRVKSWRQLEPWLKSINYLDLNLLWELAFQFPTNWYAHQKPYLARVLQTLGRRAFDLRRSIVHLARIGYFANLDYLTTLGKAPSSSETLSLQRSEESSEGVTVCDV